MCQFGLVCGCASSGGMCAVWCAGLAAVQVFAYALLLKAPIVSRSAAAIALLVLQAYSTVRYTKTIGSFTHATAHHLVIQVCAISSVPRAARLGSGQHLSWHLDYGYLLYSQAQHQQYGIVLAPQAFATAFALCALWPQCRKKRLALLRLGYTY